MINEASPAERTAPKPFIEKCIACKLCELRCPDLAIEVITEEKDG